MQGLKSRLSLFPNCRGCSLTFFCRGLHMSKGFPMKGGPIRNIRSLDPGSYDML